MKVGIDVEEFEDDGLNVTSLNCLQMNETNRQRFILSFFFRNEEECDNCIVE